MLLEKMEVVHQMFAEESSNAEGMIVEEPAASYGNLVVNYKWFF